MGLPTEKATRASGRAAIHSLLRFFVATLAFGYVQLLTGFLRTAILAWVPPGDAPAVNLASSLEVGANWLVSMVAVTVMSVALKALLLAWAVKSRSRPVAHPVGALVVGLGGVMSSLLAVALDAAQVAYLGRVAEIESLAARSVAVTMSSYVGTALDWALSLAILTALFVNALRLAGEPTRDGPYREPAS